MTTNEKRLLLFWVNNYFLKVIEIQVLLGSMRLESSKRQQKLLM
jgi:hypothetical protein